jgi:3'-phosphoadenosine 5'-phosphosulfate sulfotransferase (PAPS reductase)/FAD synthetase
MITLAKFGVVVLNSSGGKDSQTTVRDVVRLADEQGYPRSRIVVSHQLLGRMEWPGTEELVHRHADYYGLECHVAQYRDRAGNELELLDYVRRRGKWPDRPNRYCTSEFKRGPGGRVLTKMARRLRAQSNGPMQILNVYGFRAEESPERRKKPAFVENRRFSRKTVKVYDWSPIHVWTEAEVWADIRRSGVPHHSAYDLGMTRLSCSFCIFAPRSALLIAGRERPELLEEYVALEEEMGHDFRHHEPLAGIQREILADTHRAPPD